MSQYRFMRMETEKALAVLETGLPFAFFSETFLDPCHFRLVNIEYCHDALGIRLNGQQVSSENPVRVDRFFSEIVSQMKDLNHIFESLENDRRIEGYEMALEPVSVLLKTCRLHCRIVRLKHGQYFLMGFFLTIPKKLEGENQTPAVSSTQETVSLQVEKEIAEENSRTPAFDAIVGESPAIVEVKKAIEKITRLSTTVFLQGSEGTGKELVARAIHERSSRFGNPFVVFSFKGMSDELLDAELFGKSSGEVADTEGSKGLFETAEGGTLFLDEVTDLSLPIQAKLLRALQDGEIRIPGTARYRKTDVRVIVASHRDLEPLVKENKFRDDLFYEICVFSIKTPLLKNRGEDLLLLAEHFLKEFASAQNKPITGIAPLARILLMDHSWPGNVRELRNVIERAAIHSESDMLEAADLVITQPEKETPSPEKTSVPDRVEERIETLSRMKIVAALEKNDWNKTLTAKELNMSRATLWRKLKGLSIITPSR